MTAPRRLSDRYELGELLGLGGMSEVHLARDLRLHRDVAVKLLRADFALDPGLNLRFQREARDAAALNHPAIAAVYDTGEVQTPSGSLPYIVMEYIDGPTLRDITRASGPMEARRAIEVMARACEALNFSHQRGIIHRDVKPANIMIGTAGSVKVVDFGIAKAMAGSDHDVTQTGAVIGTAQYLSPEQARGDRVDARADVYALGCVLYEICTGEPPFVGDSAVAVAYQHVRQEPIPPSTRNSELPPELDAVVLKAMAKNPDNRYQTADEMRAELVRLSRGLTSGTSPTTSDAGETSAVAPPGSRGRAGSTGRRWLIAVAVLACFTIVGAIGLNAVDDSRRDVTVPDVHGLSSDRAIAVLQNGGFGARVRQSTDGTVPRGLVIDTDPAVNTAVVVGEEITLNVSTGPTSAPEAPEAPEAPDAPDASTGPAQSVIPDVSSLTYSEAVRTLTEAGFGRFQQAFLPSLPEQKDRVLITNPTAARTTAITSEITIVLGSGPAGAVP